MQFSLSPITAERQSGYSSWFHIRWQVNCNLSPTYQPISVFPLDWYPKEAGILLLSPFHSSYLALILLGHHGREEKLPQLWQDISTSMTRSYHGRGDLTIPASFSYFSYYFWVLSLWDILLFSICPETNSMDVSAFPYTHLLNKV